MQEGRSNLDEVMAVYAISFAHCDAGRPVDTGCLIAVDVVADPGVDSIYFMNETLQHLCIEVMPDREHNR